MTNTATQKSQRVRFEEVTPTNEIVAYFNARLPSLIAGTGLPIFLGYDDLDYIQFAYVTLPSGNTVVLGQYENAPEIGVDLYVELDLRNKLTAISTNIAALVVETLRYLAIPRATAVWFHPDYETEVARLYSQSDEFESISKNLTEELIQSSDLEPIDCFYYALEIYTRPKFPEHWAMLQHNLGLAYFDRIKDERWRNLQKSIAYFNKSLEVFDRDKYPRKWQINQDDLSQSQEALKVEKQNLAQDILNRPIEGRYLFGADLTGTFLSDADLTGANLNYANLSGADLTGTYLNNANLSGADLTGTYLNYANLSGADLRDANLSNAYLRRANLHDAILSATTNLGNARFAWNEEISELMRQDLISRGAIFDDAPGDRSESRSLVPH
jgi:hypothetical protein